MLQFPYFLTGELPITAQPQILVGDGTYADPLECAYGVADRVGHFAHLARAAFVNRHA